MNKVVYGILLGGFLGIFDGLTAWFTPAVRNDMLGIVIGSTMKGMLVGVIAGFFARKVNSMLWGTVVGLAAGMLFAFFIAEMQKNYYLEIMLPGSIVGAIVGYATQKHQPARTASRTA